MKTQLFDLDDISIIQSYISEISSRSECDVFYNNFLPLIAAPMDTVIDNNNYKLFLNNGIIPCIPRGQYLNRNNKDFVFQSFGLNEIEQQIESIEELGFNEHLFFNYKYVLIDIANGNMKRLFNVVKKIKLLYPNIILMVGNVANPLTFKQLCLCGADYVRLGIGGGSACLTASNLGIYYPIGSLITECYKIKKDNYFKTKIIADGGMKSYMDIIKSLALGADFVMCGSLFNKCIESSGFNYLYNIKINNKIAKFLWYHGFPIKKKYRGMSTKSVQKSWGKTKLTTAEGITKYQNVDYDLNKWTTNFKDYLKSCMSYCNCNNLNEFIGEVEWKFISANSFKRFFK